MNSKQPILVSQIPLFSELAADEVDSILDSAGELEVSAGRQLQSACQVPTHLFLIKEGRARYCKVTKTGQEIVLRVLARGDVIGLGCLLAKPLPCMLSAEAISDCHLLSWQHIKFRQLIKAHPQIAENGFRIVLEYLREYVERHSRLLSGVAEERLALTLLDLAERTGLTRPDGVEIEATNEQLGSLSDISPFTTSRLLNEWQRHGTLSKTRGRVMIHAPEDLACNRNATDA